MNRLTEGLPFIILGALMAVALTLTLIQPILWP